MSKSKKKGAKRKAAKSVAKASASATRSETSLPEDDLVRGAMLKLAANPGDNVSGREARARFFVDVLVIVVASAAAAQGVNEIAASPEPDLVKIAAMVCWALIGLYFANRCVEWKARM